MTIIESLLYKWLVIFNAFKLTDLSRPLVLCGLSTRLQDIRMTNIAALASTAPSNLAPFPFRGKSTPPLVFLTTIVTPFTLSRTLPALEVPSLVVPDLGF